MTLSLEDLKIDKVLLTLDLVIFVTSFSRWKYLTGTPELQLWCAIEFKQDTFNNIAFHYNAVARLTFRFPLYESKRPTRYANEKLNSISHFSRQAYISQTHKPLQITLRPWCWYWCVRCYSMDVNSIQSCWDDLTFICARAKGFLAYPTTVGNKVHCEKSHAW